MRFSPYAFREVVLIVLLKTVFENLNLVKSYDRTKPIGFVFGLWKKTGGFNFFSPEYF